MDEDAWEVVGYDKYKTRQDGHLYEYRQRPSEITDDHAPPFERRRRKVPLEPPPKTPVAGTSPDTTVGALPIVAGVVCIVAIIICLVYLMLR